MAVDDEPPVGRELEGAAGLHPPTLETPLVDHRQVAGAQGQDRQHDQQAHLHHAHAALDVLALGTPHGFVSSGSASSINRSGGPKPASRASRSSRAGSRSRRTATRRAARSSRRRASSRIRSPSS